MLTATAVSVSGYCMSLQPFFKQHWPWIAWLAGIFILTGMPGDYVPRVRRLEDWIEYDKAAHFLLFLYWCS
ncbi:MAG: hypothetical protein U5L09_17570 [Bacteroidales bacterium]|nr:hypothetical protein [Bacteroidales bacterium]